MTNKTQALAELDAQPSQIGASIEALFATIMARREHGDAASYTCRLLDGPLDALCKKVAEESLETCLAAKETQMLDAYADDDAIDASIDHLRYEAADVVYHLLVLLARFDVPLDELAAELNARMRAEERPRGAVLLREEHIRRGR